MTVNILSQDPLIRDQWTDDAFNKCLAERKKQNISQPEQQAELYLGLIRKFLITGESCPDHKRKAVKLYECGITENIWEKNETTKALRAQADLLIQANRLWQVGCTPLTLPDDGNLAQEELSAVEVWEGFTDS